MKRYFQGIIVGVVATLFLDNVVSATGVKSTIEVMFNEMTVKINGDLVKEDNILYQGTTYVPLRFVSEKFGYKVDWEEDTNIVNLTDKVDANMIDKEVDYIGNGICPTNVISDNSSVNYFTMRYKTKTDILEDSKGKSYDSYFMLSDKVKKKVHVIFETEGKYDTFETELGLTKKAKDTKQNLTFRIFIDGDEVFIHNLKAGDKPQHISVNIKDAKEVKFEIEADREDEYYEIGLFDNKFIIK